MKITLVTMVTWLGYACAKGPQRSLRAIQYFWANEGINDEPSGTSCLELNKGVTSNIELVSSKQSWYISRYSDPNWWQQWNLHDYRGSSDALKVVNVMDHAVVGAHWHGYTGRGVTVAVVGGTIDAAHPDLLDSVESRLCYGLEPNHYAPQAPAVPTTPPGQAPKQRSWPVKLPASTVQATRAAGVIAMKPNNGHCGVGIAYEAKVAGIYTSGPSASNQELAEAFSHKLLEFDIYLDLWGTLDGRMTPIGEPVRLTMLRGVEEGRKGNGLLYVVGSGDGKSRYKENCGADHLVNNMHTIAIASATQRGKVTPYGERCAAIMATAYSSGNATEEALVATDPGGACTTGFGESAAAASVAAGIIALILQANALLGYRDVMHIIALSSEVAPLADNPDTWRRNKAGFWVSNDFGFGLLNARNAVLIAKSWEKVGHQASCTVSYNFDIPLRLVLGKTAMVEYATSGCGSDLARRVTFIEQVELRLSVWYVYRGALQVSLRSPDSAVETVIMEPRPHDYSQGGYHEKLSFKTVQNWGEQPSGHWKVAIMPKLNKPIYQWFIDHLYKLATKPLECGLFWDGCFHGFSLTFYGLTNHHTVRHPLPRSYSAFRLPDGSTSADPFDQ